MRGKDVLAQLVNIAMIFVVTFVVFPGVAATWKPQLDFFVSKGAWASYAPFCLGCWDQCYAVPGPLGQDWYTTLVVGIFQIFDVVGRATPKAQSYQLSQISESSSEGAREDWSFPEESLHSCMAASGIYSSCMAANAMILHANALCAVVELSHCHAPMQICDKAFMLLQRYPGSIAAPWQARLLNGAAL